MRPRRRFISQVNEAAHWVQFNCINCLLSPRTHIHTPYTHRRDERAPIDRVDEMPQHVKALEWLLSLTPQSGSGSKKQSQGPSIPSDVQLLVTTTGTGDAGGASASSSSSKTPTTSVAHGSSSPLPASLRLSTFFEFTSKRNDGGQRARRQYAFALKRRRRRRHNAVKMRMSDLISTFQP